MVLQVGELKVKLQDQESITADYLQVSKQRDDANRLKDEAEKKMRQWDRIVTAVLAWEAVGYGPEILRCRLEDAVADYRQQTEKRKCDCGGMNAEKTAHHPHCSWWATR